MAQSFEDMVSMTPEFGPLNADQEPTQDEIDALDDINAEVLMFIHGPNNGSVMGMVGNSPELYQGVAAAAFQILLATKQKFEAGGEKVPPAALFGEGGAIHTTIDEIFQLAQAAGMPGSEDQDHYNAAMMEVMRLAGDHIEKTNDDASVGEAQELLIDIETADGQAGGYQPVEEDVLAGTIQRSLDAQNQALQPQQVPEDAATQKQQANQANQGALPQQTGVLGNV